MNKIFHHGSSSGSTTAGGSGQQVASAVLASTGSAVSTGAGGQNVDVEAVLGGMEANAGQKLDWRHSIVDLMKLLGLDSSLSARKELAQELHYTGDANDSAVPPGVFWTQDAAMRPPVLGRVRRTIRAWSAQGCDRHSSPAASARCSAQRRPGPRREPPRHCGKSGPTRPAP